jgi:hypothetical protein
MRRGTTRKRPSITRLGTTRKRHIMLIRRGAMSVMREHMLKRQQRRTPKSTAGNNPTLEPSNIHRDAPRLRDQAVQSFR